MAYSKYLRGRYVQAYTMPTSAMRRRRDYTSDGGAERSK
jgi:hypothetical protein